MSEDECRSSEPAADRIDRELRSALDAFEPTDLQDLETTRRRRSGVAQQAPDTDSGIDVSDHVVPARGATPPVCARVYRPADADALAAALIWIHGGGFVTGGIAQNDARCRDVARATGSVVVSPDYRLAPEHKAPAALDDCWSSLLWAVEHSDMLGVDTSRVAVGGSSAGACLAAGLALAARDAGGPRLRFQVLLHPVLDDRPSTWSAATRVWDAAHAAGCWSMYLGADHEGADVSPYLAPGRALDLRELPPTYILAAEFDVVRDQAIDFAARLLRADVATELHVVPGTYHSFEAVAPNAAVSRRARAEWLGAVSHALRPVP